MRIEQAMKDIISKRGYSIRSFGEHVGVQGSSVGRTLRSENASVGKVTSFAGALGYDVVLVPQGSKLPDGSYVLDGGEQHD